MRCPWREVKRSTAVGAVTISEVTDWEECLGNLCPFYIPASSSAMSGSVFVPARQCLRVGAEVEGRQSR